MLTLQNINSGYILTGRGSMFFEESLQVESSKVNIISDKEQDDIKKDLEIAVTQLEEDRDTIKVLKKIIKRQLSEIEELKKALKMQSPA